MPNTNAGLAALKILHRALLAGQLIFLAIILYVSYKRDGFPLEDYGQVFFWIVVIAGIAAFVFNRKQFSNIIATIKGHNFSDEEKLSKYRASTIKVWAFLELVIMLSVIFYFLSGNFYILIITALLILDFYALKPTAEKVASQLDLCEAHLDDKL